MPTDIAPTAAFLVSLLVSGSQVTEARGTVTGEVTAPDGAGVAGERLELVCGADTLVVHTDHEGRFTLGNVPRQPCQLYLRPRGTDYRRRVAEWGSDRPAHVVVPLMPNEMSARPLLTPTRGFHFAFDAARDAAGGASVRIDRSTLWTTGIVRGWNVSSQTRLGHGSSTQVLADVGSKGLPLYSGEWAWTGVAGRTFGDRSTFTFSAGVAHYDTPPTLLSRGEANAMSSPRVVAPLSLGNPATLWETRARVDHRLFGERRQLGVFGEGAVSSSVGTFRETGLGDGRSAGAASTGKVVKGGLTFSF